MSKPKKHDLGYAVIARKREKPLTLTGKITKRELRRATSKVRRTLEIGQGDQLIREFDTLTAAEKYARRLMRKGELGENGTVRILRNAKGGGLGVFFECFVYVDDLNDDFEAFEGA